MNNLDSWAKEYIQELIFNEEWEALEVLLGQVKHFTKYNKIRNFSPYSYQRKFYDAGSQYRYRFLMGANRIGKSFSMAYEMSLHLTGKYPEDWKGKKFREPILAWAIGITTDSTRKVLQKELIGTVSAKETEELGTGAIPRDEMDLKSMERDGNLVKIIRIKHHTDGVFDGYSTLEFRSTQQGEQVLMGQSVHYIWLDEQDPHKDMQIYAQCVTRTANTRGIVAISATPEAKHIWPLLMKAQGCNHLTVKQRELLGRLRAIAYVNQHRSKYYIILERSETIEKQQ